MECKKIQDWEYRAKPNSKEKASERTKRYRERNRDKIRLADVARARERRANNPEQARECRRAFRKAHPDYDKKYYAKNREYRRWYARIWQAGRPRNRLSDAMSCGIWYSIKGNKAGKKWESLVGYTLHDLKKHLERMFQKGMTWANYGKWHVDHRRPICSFDLTNEEQFSDCWSLTNLEPMWATENLSKGGKLVFLI